MPRMIDLIRKSAVPSNLMQFAAKGALLVPAPEMVEILVYLAAENKVFGQQARLTLAGWDPVSAAGVAADPATSEEVLDYFIDPENLRPDLLPVLLENPSVKESRIAGLSLSATREQVEALLKSARAGALPEVLNALLSNPNLREEETKTIREKLASLATPANAIEVPVQTVSDEPAEETASSAHQSAGQDSDEVLTAFMDEHLAEIAAENDKTFQPAATFNECSTEAAEVSDPIPVQTATSDGAAAAPARHAVAKKWILSAEEQRGSALQKISKLDVKGRINLAFKGTKEERSILIRDGTKIVALAVLESPKVTDGEVEKFASQKNVLEAVLRAIPMKRRFMKIYPVVRNLTFNPRAPIDVSLALIKNLLVQDLRHLAGNKEVSDTVRKLALKMFRQKLDTTKKH